MSLNVKVVVFMLMCMTGCQKHIVEANVREAYLEKLETNQIYKIKFDVLHVIYFLFFSVRCYSNLCERVIISLQIATI